ncbi:MAG: hypothetical protein WD823_06985 [Sulfuricaulis sp.]|uniref:hypothetical protein n=1 Tax=Sulfuricaulis sp. TaxID=2003553 RepID=UPI0034A4E8FA
MTKATENINDRAVRELGQLLGKCAAAEAEVATTYFSKPHTEGEHEKWLRVHTGRELCRVYQLGGILSAQLAGLGVTVEPATYIETATKLIEETNHFVMGYDLLTWFTGKAPNIGELRKYDIFRPDPDLPENKWSIHLAQEKKAIEEELARETAPWASLPGDEGILEGGGSGMFFAAGRIKGGEFESRVAAMMQVVLDDELRHGAHQLENVRSISLTEKDLEKIKEYVRRHANARVRFRNAHFDFPLSEQRMKEIENGGIEPLFVWEEVDKAKAHK